MPKVKIYSVNRKEKQRIEDELFEIISKLKTKQEVFDFMIELFTESETLMIGRRIQVAKMILQGFSYDEIKSKMKVGFQTISKIEHWLRNDEKRTEFIKGKIKKAKNDQKAEKALRRTSLDRYAHHRFLKNLIN